MTPGQHFTKPPPHFSEAALVKALEELGIGRPSTYASILRLLQVASACFFTRFGEDCRIKAPPVHACLIVLYRHLDCVTALPVRLHLDIGIGSTGTEAFESLFS